MDKKQLAYFEKVLKERKKVILSELGQNADEIAALYESEPNDSADFSIIDTSSQIDIQISENLKQELSEIKRSLNKIKDETYGICELCEEDIDTQRLKIKPFARYCIKCRQIVEERQKNQ